MCEIIKAVKYKIIRKIGQGQYGTVYKLEKNNKYYALKKISINNLKEEEEEKEKYKEEAKILSTFNNEYIIKYIDSYIENDYFNILMEYGGDYNLNDFIKIYKDKGKNIEEYIIKDIIIQICNGLKVIHNAKIIHRDLKPNNILMDKYNKIKIVDFGLSKILRNNEPYANSQVGTPYYIAPEIIEGKQYINKVDIYSLGCIIYELFTLSVYRIDLFLIDQINEQTSEQKNEQKKEQKGKINTDIYNPKWQELIDLLLKKDFNKRPNINEVYNKIKELDNKVILTIKIDKNDIGKTIYFLDNANNTNNPHGNLKEMNELNTELYINDIRHKFKKYFIPKEEGLYTIKIVINCLIHNCTYMFAGCENIINIDLSSFNTRYVTNMSYMFYLCSNLNNINLLNFNTENVKDMEYMFYWCINLINIDLSSFNTQNVTKMNNIFSGCTGLKKIDLSSFNTENLENMECMFFNCKSTESIILTSFNTKNVINMKGLFTSCETLKIIDLSSFDINENEMNKLNTEDILAINQTQTEIKIKKKLYDKILKDNPNYIDNNIIKNATIVDNPYYSQSCILF